MIDGEWDAIVVGAGPAGSAVAARLSDDPRCRVLLIEAGPDYRPADAPEEMRRGHWTRIIDRGRFPQFQWLSLNARRRPGRAPEPLWRGRGVGGSAAINGQVALRPPLSEFDEWAAAGAPVWGAAMALEGFRAIERDLAFGAMPYHGASGPIPISRAPIEAWSALDRAVFAAFRELGLPEAEDCNAPGTTGLSAFPYNALDEVRIAANEGYLEPIRTRPNLRILGDALVDRVLFEGARVIGVAVTGEDGRSMIRGGLVILSAGAIHSPAILMRSGIGPAEHLRSLGIAARRDLPVGSRYQEHPHIYFGFAIEPAQGIARNARHTNLCVRWSSGHPGTGFNDMAAVVNGPAPDTPRTAGIGFTINQAFSRGTVRLASADPHVDPAVEMNLADDPRDRARLRDAVEMARRLLDRPALRGMAQGPIVDRSGGPVDLALETIDAWIDATVDGSAHSASSCPLDAPERGVLDAEARPFAVERLHVVDLSITPSSPRANPNLTAFMIGEHFGRRLATLYQRSTP